MTYSDLVSFLLDTASGLTYSGSTGLTVRNVEFGPDFNVGMNSSTVYPLFYLTPVKSTIGKESVTSYSFQIIILDRILGSDNRADRPEKYSRTFEWLVAYFEYLNPLVNMEYEIALQPIETNYDQLATGWMVEIKIRDNYQCFYI